MLPDDLSALWLRLPEERTFNYYADKESPWLLARRMPPAARVAALKRGRCGPLLERPLVAPMVAACGGVLQRADVSAVACAEDVGAAPLSAAATAGCLAAAAVPWHDFALSFATWRIGDNDPHAQMSRPGGNLVVQLGFSSEHAALMSRHLVPGARKAFEYAAHPIRRQGRPTLAWARVDIEGDVALIEEVQSDWLRAAVHQVRHASQRAPRSRELRAIAAYERDIAARYGALWPRAMLLATLDVLERECAVRTVYMHQSATGALLKGIRGTQPPRSLYGALPKRFGFEAVREAPPFLRKRWRRALKALARTEAALFWRLDLDACAAPQTRPHDA